MCFVFDPVNVHGPNTNHMKHRPQADDKQCRWPASHSNEQNVRSYPPCQSQSADFILPRDKFMGVRQGRVGRYPLPSLSSLHRRCKNNAGGNGIDSQAGAFEVPDFFRYPFHPSEAKCKPCPCVRQNIDLFPSVSTSVFK